jgi:hypothetical protein
MFSKTVVRVLLAAALVAPAVAAQAVTIDTVTVGSAGNAEKWTSPRPARERLQEILQRPRFTQPVSSRRSVVLRRDIAPASGPSSA